jgi:hypothetical protein
MTGQPPNTDQETIARQAQSPRDNRILGLSTDELAGLSVDELMSNKTAITMMMHYYKLLVDENNSLRNDANTLRTYVDSYSKKKTNASVGAVLLLISNVGIGFGVNLLTNGTIWPGLVTLLPGLAMAAAGLFFSLREGR